MTDFKIINKDTIFDKPFLKLHKIDISYPSPNGIINIERFIVQKNHAVCVTLYDPVKEVFAVIKEFRSGMIFDGDEPVSFGLSAGHIELNETPETAAKREVLEETGLDIADKNLIFLAESYVSPGFTNEKHYHYLAKIDIDKLDLLSTFGVDDESIQVCLIHKKDVLSMIQNKQINTSYLIVGLLIAMSIT